MEEFFKHFTPGLFRYDVINRLIMKYWFKSYLEIGVENGTCFSNVNCRYKTGVDPDPRSAATVFMTSDEYFESISDDVKFDIIFIDGLHRYEQCYRDIVNATKHLNDGGFILCHDMNPLDKMAAAPEQIDNLAWNGDVWRSFVKFRQDYRNYSSCLLYDLDWGVGVITKGIGQSIMVDVDKLTFEDWQNSKQYLMNCMKTEDFLRLFC